MNRIATALFALLIVAGAGAQSAATKTYTNRTLGLALDYPAEWPMAATKKDEAKFTLGDGAVVEVYPNRFRQEAAAWQTLQAQISQQMDRRLERQWEEEILGVPLLMTKVAYELAGQPTKTLVGLLYTASPTKLLFRLTAPAAGFDAAESLWRSAMQTLRTTTGNLPTVEDPTKPVAPKRPVEATVRPLAPKVVLSRATIAPEFVATQAGGEGVRLHFPKGWTAEASEGGFLLKHPNLAGIIRVAVNALLDSPAPELALAEAAASSLSEFDTVSLRIDSRPRGNRALAQVMEIRRLGTAKGAKAAQLLAAGLKDRHYWFLSYRGEGDAAERDRGLVRELVEQLSVEPAP